MKTVLFPKLASETTASFSPEGEMSTLKTLAFCFSPVKSVMSGTVMSAFTEKSER